VGDDRTLRRGLDPVPGRVPRLPGHTSPAEPVPDEPFRPEPRGVQSVPLVPGTEPRRTHRPQEFQLDKQTRDWIDCTAFAIRQRTGRGFNRSSLARALVQAVLRSGLDIDGQCASEEEIITYVMDFLPQKSL
jgi:hypothetical protein